MSVGLIVDIRVYLLYTVRATQDGRVTELRSFLSPGASLERLLALSMDRVTVDMGALARCPCPVQVPLYGLA